jgi:hypothetical protein
MDSSQSLRFGRTAAARHMAAAGRNDWALSKETWRTRPPRGSCAATGPGQNTRAHEQAPAGREEANPRRFSTKGEPGWNESNPIRPLESTDSIRRPRHGLGFTCGVEEEEAWWRRMDAGPSRAAAPGRERARRPEARALRRKGGEGWRRRRRRRRVRTTRVWARGSASTR